MIAAPSRPDHFADTRASLETVEQALQDHQRRVAGLHDTAASLMIENAELRSENLRLISALATSNTTVAELQERLRRRG